VDNIISSLFILPFQTKSVSVGQLDDANKVVHMALDIFNILVSLSRVVLCCVVLCCVVLCCVVLCCVVLCCVVLEI
jgi:hypothetical protein